MASVKMSKKVKQILCNKKVAVFLAVELAIFTAVALDLASTSVVLSQPAKFVEHEYVTSDGAMCVYTEKISGVELHPEASVVPSLVLFSVANLLVAWLPLSSKWNVVRVVAVGVAFFPAVNNLVVLCSIIFY